MDEAGEVERSVSTYLWGSIRMAKANFDPRKLMERAIEVMRKSVAEHREDKKACPMVGAVVWKPDGTVETACRGEIRDGDHAEFTLLERKNRHVSLDGAVLFATLEPCAPSARNPPKLGCAERIVLARIKEVWIGITDPDPKVDRRGMTYLEEHGVVVKMFDRDLQDIIHAENKEFIEQAVERAAEAEKEPTIAKPLGLKAPLYKVTLKDLSMEALRHYRSIARVSEDIGSTPFNQRLSRIGLLDETKNGFTPTGYGFLAFGTEPRTVLPQAGLLATIHYPNGTDETRDFDGSLVLIPSQVEAWLRDKLPNVIDRSQMHRRRVDPLPFEMIREAVVNALVHRDYDIRGAKCQLVVSADAVAVQSPGMPMPPVTLQQLQKFNAPMLSRNSELHYVFGRMDLAEERGFGLKSLARRAKELGLPQPRYEWRDPYLTLKLFQNMDAALKDVPIPELLATAPEIEKTGWRWLATQEQASSPDYARALKLDDRSGRRHLNRWSKLGLVEKVGSARSTRYKVR